MKDRSIRFKLEIPEGYRVFFAFRKIKGISGHGANARKFAAGKRRELFLVPERSDLADRNAVRVVGTVAGFLRRRRLMLGHLDSLTADHIAASGGADPLLCGLRKVVTRGRDVEVEFDILGPDPLYESFF